MASVCNLKDRAHQMWHYPALPNPYFQRVIVLYREYPVDLTIKLLTAAQEINGTSQEKEIKEF